MYKRGGKKTKNKSSFMEESKELTFGGMKYKNGGLYSAAEKAENIAKVKKMNSMQNPEHQTQVEKKTGGRFDAMVSKLKGQGKSEDSAKAIAASIGRKKYGKSKFQEMAAKGKKGLGGMSDSTSANDAGMGMMEAEESMNALDAMKKRKKKRKTGVGKFLQDVFTSNSSTKGTSGSRHTGPNASRAKKAGRKAATGKSKCARGETCFD